MVNIVRYIPVDVATNGLIPIITKTGQKIAPGPTPQKAAEKAPKKEIQSIIIKSLGVDLKSPSTNE